MKTKTKRKFVLQLAKGRKATFIAKGKKRFEIGNGMILINADILTNDNTRYDAILEIDEDSSGEHCRTYIVDDETGLFICQEDKDFLEKLGKTNKQFFPYRYKLRAKLICEDIHTDLDGWSIH